MSKQMLVFRGFKAILGGILFAVVGCGTSSVGPLVTVKFDSSVAEKDQKAIESDLKLLSTIQFDSTNDSSLMGLANFDSNTVSNWLSDRMKYVVGEEWEEDENQISEIYDTDATGVVTVMSNFGAGVYASYNKRGDTNYPKYQIAGDTIRITSPRVGVFRIGEGHFIPVAQGMFHSLTSVANGVKRLATLFHEARHSDGSGNSAGFLHVTCPSGDYKGESACDKYKNGPYTVGAMMLRHLFKACNGGRCSQPDRIHLMLQIADLKSRKIGDNEGSEIPVPVTK